MRLLNISIISLVLLFNPILLVAQTTSHLSQVNSDITKLNNKLTKIEERIEKIEKGEKDILTIAKNDFKTANTIIGLSTFILGAVSFFIVILGLFGFLKLSHINNVIKELEDLVKDYTKKLGDFEKTIESLDKNQKELDRKFSEKNREYLNIVYSLNEGIVNFQAGNLKDAINSFKKVLKIKPRDYEATCYLARAYTGKGLFEEAIQTIEPARKMSNKPDRAYFILGEAYRRMGKYRNAIESFKKSIKILNPDLSDFNGRERDKILSALNNLGYSYFRNEELEPAIATFKEVLKYKRNNHSACCGLGKCYLFVNNNKMYKIHFTETITYANEALENGSSGIWAFYNIAFSHLAVGSIENNRCLHYLKIALNKNKNLSLIKEQRIDYEAAKEVSNSINLDLINECCKRFDKTINSIQSQNDEYLL